MIQEAFQLDAYVAVLERDQRGLDRERTAVAVSHLFAHRAGALGVHRFRAFAEQHQAGRDRMRRMHQRRESGPVVRPALHILIMRAAHVLDPSELAFFIKIFEAMSGIPI